MAERRMIAVFCGAGTGNDPRFEKATYAFGQALARRGLGLVYGGGAVGLMGAVADGALSEGGHVVGVIPNFMVEKELAHRGVADMRIVHSMHERKALMAKLADGFVALPGGLGTLDELLEILTWAQLGLHRKPIALLNVAGMHDGLVALLDRLVGYAFLPQQTRDLLYVDDRIEVLIDHVVASFPATDRTHVERA
jgi:uncharacterized protein (TIGR00730 family)